MAVTAHRQCGHQDIGGLGGFVCSVTSFALGELVRAMVKTGFRHPRVLWRDAGNRPLRHVMPRRARATRAGNTLRLMTDNTRGFFKHGRSSGAGSQKVVGSELNIRANRRFGFSWPRQRQQGFVLLMCGDHWARFHEAINLSKRRQNLVNRIS
jgi:hypothetical protein